MQKINHHVEFIDSRLKHWAEWYDKCIRNESAGYGSKNIVLSALEGSRSTAPKYPPDNTYAEQVNKIVIHMGRIYPEREQVLRMEYTEPGSQVQKAKKMQISRILYRNVLELAKTWIEASLF